MFFLNGGKVERITSQSNRWIREVRELSRKAKARKESGLFVAEGERLCAEIPEAALVRLFLSDGYTGTLPKGSTPEARGVYRIPEELMASVSDTKTSQGILAVVRQRPKPFPKGDFFLVLENLQDPGNMGTIFRTAEAAGVQGILMNQGCADPYSPKVVRSAMGALFRMPFRIVPSLPEELERLKQSGLRIYAAHLNGSRSYFEKNYREGCVFLIGNEGNGLTEELTACATDQIRIPMCGETESLNAAVAASVLMYEVLRQRL